MIELYCLIITVCFLFGFENVLLSISNLFLSLSKLTKRLAELVHQTQAKFFTANLEKHEKNLIS